MAMLIDQIDSSGLFAQSAYSASIATHDSVGNVITATYLTAHQDISNKLDTTAFSTVSGDFYPYSNPSGFITGVDLSNYYTKNETSGADELANAFSSIPAGDPAVNSTVQNNSATWNDVTNKLDTTAFSTVSGTFLTAHQDLSNYVTETDLESTSATITAMIPSTAGLATETDLQIVSAGVDYISSVALTSVDLTPYLTTATYAADSGTFATTSMLNDYQTTAGMTAYASTGDISGTQWNSNYETVNTNSGIWNESYNTLTSNSSTWNNVTNKLDTTAFSTVSGTFLTAHQDISATEWNSVYETVESNSASWAGGGSVDTVPFIVQSPLTTGFSGTSAYIGLDGEAFESSAYVPVSSLTFANNYLTQISGKTISAYTARNAYTATYATTASRATNDINGNSITATYQPKLTIAGVDGTITAINNSAVGADVPSGFELVAGSNISIVDDAQNSATTISVSGISAAEWNDCYETVETNSATWGGGGTSYTGDAQGALDTVYGSSANWNGCYSTVESNSATWNNAMTGLFQAQYGVTDYNTVKSAVDNCRTVYCVTGNRMAFLAYSGTDNFEFQYYRSVGTHTDSQQGDQVFVYKIMNTNQWTTTVRNAFTKVIAGTGLSSTYTNGASGKIELSIDGSFIGNYATTGDLNYVSGVVGDVESLLAQL